MSRYSVKFMILQEKNIIYKQLLAKGEEGEEWEKFAEAERQEKLDEYLEKLGEK